ncbi:hypothetical protein DL96DRAFT_1525428 [Flagelloscypha sp. PMI_526]|nr:hypothetical protein DL96DRAFT_1525428 [Flagelloscypha sp. PMI_526]
MSAQIYPRQTYQPPLRAKTNYPVERTPTKQQQPVPPVPAKDKSPLSRQTAKTRPPSPPDRIVDFVNDTQYIRGHFLGEGGFARVYHVKDASTNRSYALKVISRTALKTKKAKTKLYAEIKIHGMLDQSNIVKFHGAFDDDENVYMILSLCTNGSLMDFLRMRRRFSEGEARFYMLQLISACAYMHNHSIIHRDLKLGNLFLDSDMNLQVGDFGLAALIETEGQRKKTICGTPNYIAPEVLFDSANGHSFEVDTWSVGVILYTLVVGKPPFQTKDVKEIYERIRQNNYSFPSATVPSAYAQDLITRILTPDPSARPSLCSIVEDHWFVRAPVPLAIPTSALRGEPDFSHIGRRDSVKNLLTLRKKLALEIVDFERAEVEEIQDAKSIPGLQSLASRLDAEEKQFAKAVQPGSPLGMLLNEARKPLVKSPVRSLHTAPRGMDGNAANPFQRVVKTKGASPLKQSTMAAELAASAAPISRSPRLSPSPEDQEAEVNPATTEEEMNRSVKKERRERKELESQKARIVCQMLELDEEKATEPIATRAAPPHPEVRRRGAENQLPTLGASTSAKEPTGQSNLRRTTEGRKLGLHHPGSALAPPTFAASSSRTRVNSGLAASKGPSTKAKVSSSTSVKQVPAPSSKSVTGVRHQPSRPGLLATHTAMMPPSILPSGATGFAAAAHVLNKAFTDKMAGKISRDPRRGSHGLRGLALSAGRGGGNGGWDEVPEEPLFIVSWVDYCHKYGMGYALTDGSVGVHFNDSTCMILSPDSVHFDYITPLTANSSEGDVATYRRESFAMDDHPEELKAKVYLMRHFEQYIMGRLYGEYTFCFTRSKEAIEALNTCRYLSPSTTTVHHGDGRKQTRGMEWVMNYLRMKHVIVFRLSHDVLQFNFYDHTKIVLSQAGMRITYIDKSYAMSSWTLSELIGWSLGFAPNSYTEAETKTLGRLLQKVTYCKEVLMSIWEASNHDGHGQE